MRVEVGSLWKVLVEVKLALYKTIGEEIKKYLVMQEIDCCLSSDQGHIG